MKTEASAAFDAIADDYDEQFTHSRLGRMLRQTVRGIAVQHIHPGMRVLEIGCGTGQDAVWLAHQGVEVVATDASSRMVELTDAAVRRHGLQHRITTLQCNAEDLPGRCPPGPFDGVFSNFGALNCVPALPVLARWLTTQLPPGGTLLAVMLNPWCPWEVLWHGAHGDAQTAFRRLHPGGTEARVGDERIHVWYPSARALSRMFAPQLQLKSHVGLGVLLPPTELTHLVDRRPALFHRLAQWDQRLATLPPFRNLGDHYIVVLN